MKTTTVSVTLGLAALCGMAGSQVAAAADDTGWYVGGNAGASFAKLDDPRISSSLLDSGFTTTSISNDSRAIGGKLFGGYQFSRNFALEGGVVDLGKFGFGAHTQPAGALKGSMKVEGLDLDGVLTLPVTARFSAFGRFGLFYADTTDHFTSNGAVDVTGDPNPDKFAPNYKFGAGVEYDFLQSKALGLRLEAERYRINDAVSNQGDIDLASLGLVYRFRNAPPPAAEPQAVAIAAEPQPVVAPPIAPPAPTQKYCSVLNIEFEIDRDVMQREDREKLRVLGTFLTKYPDTRATIEGYTDNVGSADDNMKLSQRRADSVVSYLVDNFQIAPSRLTAVGYGLTRPVADNSTQEGKRQNRRIAAVIQCARDIQGLEPTPARITMGLDMEFDNDSAVVRPEYDDELRQLADFMKAHPTVTATVEGHTSNALGTHDERMQLSQRRAGSVVTYLVDNFGVARARLSAAGFGGSRRLAYNTSAEAEQENRRVNVIFDYPQNPPAP